MRPAPETQAEKIPGVGGQLLIFTRPPQGVLQKPIEEPKGLIGTTPL